MDRGGESRGQGILGSRLCPGNVQAGPPLVLSQAHLELLDGPKRGGWGGVGFLNGQPPQTVIEWFQVASIVPVGCSLQYFLPNPNILIVLVGCSDVLGQACAHVAAMA